MSAKRFVYPGIGSVSSGTMRTEDLLDTFADELRYQMRRLRLTREQRKRFNQLLRDCRDTGAGNDDHGGDTLADLFDALGEIGAPYTTFGAHEGDGADYGWWPCYIGDGSNIDDLPRIDAGDEVPREHWGGDVVFVNDHGNVECGYVDRKGKFHEYWSCV